MYNVKVQRFNDEVQLSLYRYGISTKEKKDNDKNVIKSDKQRNKTIKQSDKAIIENKIRSTRRTKQPLIQHLQIALFQSFFKPLSISSFDIS